MIKCSLSALDVTSELLWVKFGGGLTGIVKWVEQQACVKWFGASEISLQGKKNKMEQRVTLTRYNKRYSGLYVNITGQKKKKKGEIKQPRTKREYLIAQYTQG